MRRLAASLQGRRPSTLAIRLDEQVRHRQRPGHRLQDADRHVLQTPPDPSDRGTVDTGRVRQPLLRQAFHQCRMRTHAYPQTFGSEKPPLSHDGRRQRLPRLSKSCKLWVCRCHASRRSLPSSATAVIDAPIVCLRLLPSHLTRHPWMRSAAPTPNTRCAERIKPGAKR
jgi:hypothetical protein